MQEYLLLIRRLRRKMELHLKIRRQEEEEDGATLDPKVEEQLDLLREEALHPAGELLACC